MDNFHVYQDISARTGGEIYIGVVGPVRTGKSTFIKQFMELLVLPEMEDVHSREQARDELPQSAGGKTITTTEPKFIPKNAAVITLKDGLQIKARMIDCVGYMVEGALGHTEDGTERLVKTPWFEYEIPFTQAAEIGTRKVITDHSTIGILVTSDGSLGDLDRSAYMPAEEKTVQELKSLNKPFVVLLNSRNPAGADTITMAAEMSEKYDIPVLPVNCQKLTRDDIENIMEAILEEFPVTELQIHIPKWMELLPESHWMKAGTIELAQNLLQNITWMRDAGKLGKTELPVFLEEARLLNRNMSCGSVSLQLSAKPSYYYQVISEYAGLDISSEYELLRTFVELAASRSEYDKMSAALQSVDAKGYGVVLPSRGEISLNAPKIVRHGNKYGVKIKATAPSIHLIKSYIETEIAPIVGSEQQAMDLIDYIAETAKTGPEGVWDTNIFGKSIEQIVDDGIGAKISQMTDECQMKLQDTMKKIVNDSNGGMICIII